MGRAEVDRREDDLGYRSLILESDVPRMWPAFRPPDSRSGRLTQEGGAATRTPPGGRAGSEGQRHGYSLIENNGTATAFGL